MLSKTKPSCVRRLKIYILAVIVGCLTSAVMIMVLSGAMLLLQLDTALSTFLGLLALGAGCLAAGITIGKFRRRNGLAGGLKAALLMLLLCLIGTFISGNFTGTEVFSKTLVAVITGCMGGVIGVNKGAPPV